MPQTKSVLFYPKFPHTHHYTMYRICELLGYKIINDPKENFHLVFAWEDRTYRADDEILLGLIKKFKVVNAGCNDISKKRVDFIFKEVFGYNTIIDPLTYKGNCVMKSNFNAKHDGKIIKCPIRKTEENCIYQKVINSQTEDNFAQDMRVYVLKEEIPLTLLRYHPMNDRFGNTDKGDFVTPHEMFSEEEIKKINHFCKKIGLECGDLDVLRDRDDGKIYIVDVSNTPYRPYYLPEEKMKTFEKMLTEAFDRVFVNNQ